jgi:predicted nucleic acid-binding protein
VCVKKLKVYLDTSVISHLDQRDAPEKMSDTLKFWERAKTGEFDIFISPVDMEELDKCSQEKLACLRNYLSEIKLTLLTKNAESEELAKLYVDSNVLSEKHIDDCRHIAYACVANCDVIVSWNFKHIVNHKTISGVKGVNAVAGYKEMAIYIPTILISMEEHDDTL